MARTIAIKKGKDIKLVGEAEKTLVQATNPDVVAIKPPDFIGMTPKMLLKEGAEVKAGTPIFYEKTNDRIVFTSPVSGEIAEIVRGAKRRIMEVRILADKQNAYEEHGAADAKTLDREAVINHMLKAGVWPMIRQRPFSTIADPFSSPKDIYISCFDSSPLAPDMDEIIKGHEAEFQAGIDALNRISEKEVNLNLPAQGGETYAKTQGVQVNRFKGPHPAGNVGVQVHHLDPINKGEVIWYTYPQEVIIIGRLFLSGRYDARKVVAMTGSKANERKYFETILGASLNSLIDGTVDMDGTRLISGNVLTGSQVSKDGFIGFFDNQVTAIPEGNHHKFLLTEGWLSPGLNRFSMSRAYPSWLFGGKKYDLDTNLNGEVRAFVVTGQLEKVFPFDIYPMQLIKSVMTNDIDKMEKLGIYEVDAEDFALCEVVCTSKIEIQKVIREGMENLRMELA